MDTKSMTRKEFITLTFTLIGTAAAASCGSSNETPATTGVGGSGGTTGIGGAGGAAGAAGAAGGAGGTTVSACTSPLPETQLADGLGHTHSVTINSSVLVATVNQVFQTSAVADTSGVVHAHEVTLTPANLSAISAGGSVDVQ